MFKFTSDGLSTPIGASRLTIRRDILSQTVAGLRSRSHGRIESGCMWIGDRSNGRVNRVVFHHEIADDRATPLSFQLPEEAKYELYRQLALTRESVLALLHTHPFDWVDLSDVDQTNQISSRVGFWSIVLPYYAQTDWDIRTIGFHTLKHDGWSRLTEAEVTATLMVTES